jgi:hypothetical protein
MLVVWRSESEAVAPGFVEKQNSQAAHLLVVSMKKGRVSSMKERAVSRGGHGPRMVGRPE